MNVRTFLHSGLISIIFIIFGLLLALYGALKWYELGFPLNNIFPSKNDFGSNPIHISFLGMLFIVWASFNAYLNRILQ